MAVVVLGVLISGYRLSQEESPIWRYLAVIGMSFGLLELIDTGRRLWINSQTIFIRGNLIRGYPLFGHGRAANIKRITAIYRSRDWGVRTLEFRDRNGRKFCIHGEVDYFGFIWDYILERVSPECTVDWAFVKKRRNLSGVWIYTRRYPYKTEYPLGYLWPLRQVVAKQRERLVAEGKLHGGKAFYGDPHLLRIGEKDK
jgi:hypothetical protein